MINEITAVIENHGFGTGIVIIIVSFILKSNILPKLFIRDSSGYKVVIDKYEKENAELKEKTKKAEEEIEKLREIDKTEMDKIKALEDTIRSLRLQVNSLKMILAEIKKKI